MKVLITRAEPGASRTAKRLEQRGVDPVIAPFLEIAFAEEIEADLSEIDALIFTSANGVRAWLSARSEMDLPAFCVGDATAEAAREAGFTRIRSAGGDVNDLLELCVRQLDPNTHRLMYLRGEHTKGDLASRLQAKGFFVEEIIAYEAQAAISLPVRAALSLQNKDLGVVFFHSQRAAIAFTALVDEADLTYCLRSMIAVTISEAAAEGLMRIDWAAVRVAETPDEDAMLGRIGIAR